MLCAREKVCKEINETNYRNLEESISQFKLYASYV